MANELDNFFNSLSPQEKKDENLEVKEGAAQAQTVIPEKGKEGEGEGEGDEPRKNRRHRRLEEQLQKERESNIALAERIKVLSEVGKSSNSNGSDLDSRLIGVFGDTDEGKALARSFGKILSEETTAAKELAIKEFKAEQQRLIQEQKNFESLIDSELESLEDEHGVDLTSDAPAARKARREFLELVQQLSPKDGNGVITAYADFDTTFELYQKTRTKEPSGTATRAKEIASKTMQPSGQASGDQQKQPTRGFFGWKRDYNV